jgi:hypothetical protein
VPTRDLTVHDRSGSTASSAAQHECLLSPHSDRIYNLLVISWDEPKRRQNLRKHKIDLADLEPVFDRPMLTLEDDSEDYGELRLRSLGMFQGRIVLLVWTPRGDDTAHLISCRYADRQEADEYFQAL